IYVPARAAATTATTTGSASGGSSAGSGGAATSGGASSAAAASTDSSSSGATAGTGASAATAGSSSASSASTTPSATQSIVLPSRDPTTGAAVSSAAASMVPLAAFAHFAEGSSPSSINHQNTSLATTISFNLAEGASLSDAQKSIEQDIADIGMPTRVHGSFQGTARTFQDSVSDEPVLIAAALLAIYIVLGILYESYAHPLTVLSTLPSAGIGAV